MNNITMLNEDLAKRSQEEAATYGDNFPRDVELTEEEQAKIAQLEADTQTFITETGPDGTKTSIPLKEYASPLDERVTEIQNTADGVNELIKTVNKGDIKQTLEDIKLDARNRAISAFRQLSIQNEGEESSDDDILRINTAGLEAIQKYMGADRLDSDAMVKRLSKLTLKQIADILPEEFVKIYVRENEIHTNNYKAKERLLSCLAYLTATGPELDYLNEYIDNEHRLMAVSRQIVQCQMDFAEMLKDPATISEIADKAAAISPVDDTIWSKYIRDPKRVHNEFAQRAIIYTKYKEAYEKLMEEHSAEPDAMTMIQNEISECTAKYQIYSSVTKLELMRELWATLTERLKTDNRNGYKNLTREAVNALDRIRRAKQNVPFPIYDAKLAKRPEELYKLYMAQYPNMIQAYNTAIEQVRAKAAEEGIDCSGIEAIHIDGIDDKIVASYMAMLMLILYGRIMKKLSANDATKYDAIMLDAYFQCYCKLGTDIYLMSDVWSLMKGFVEYAIKTWPCPKK